MSAAIDLTGIRRDAVRTSTPAVLLQLVSEPRGRSKKRREPTSVEAQLIALIRFGAEKFGSRLLEAPDRASLEDQLDELVVDPDLERLLTLVSRSVDASVLSAATEPTGDRAHDPFKLLAAYAPVLRKLQVGARLSNAIAAAIQSFLARNPEVPRWMATSEDGEVARLLEDPMVHPELAQSEFAALKGTASFLAMVEIVQSQGVRPAPERWRVRFLVDAWVEGAKQQLRLISSFPGANVPETLVPVEERFIPELHFRKGSPERQKALAELHSRAQAAGAAIYPPVRPDEGG